MVLRTRLVIVYDHKEDYNENAGQDERHVRPERNGNMTILVSTVSGKFDVAE